MRSPHAVKRINRGSTNCCARGCRVCFLVIVFDSGQSVTTLKKLEIMGAILTGLVVFTTYDAGLEYAATFFLLYYVALIVYVILNRKIK